MALNKIFQYVELMKRYGKTGAGGRDHIRDELTEAEWLALDYIGAVSVDGEILPYNIVIVTVRK